MTTGLQGMMGFMKPDQVINDNERPGRLRANINTQNYDEAAKAVDFHRCALHDLSEPGTPIDFHKMGFDVINLASNPKLIASLQRIYQRGVLRKHAEKKLRRALTGTAFRLSNGKRLRFLYVASEGVILRKSGPNRMEINHDAVTPKNSRQSAASMVHGDQDVYGYPIKNILKGAAPYVFRHQSPDGSNRLSPLNLVNLWIPLQQITMPLCLMDRRTLDNKKHQLRMELNVTNVLDRKGVNNRNDIWTFLHDTRQQWYCHSYMPLGKAYVFDTLGMAHGAAVLPGEEQAEQGYLQLKACLEAIEKSDAKSLSAAASGTGTQTFPYNTSQPLILALETMQQLLSLAAQQTKAIINEPAEWCHKAHAVMSSLVRQSIELRAVAVVY